MDLGARDFQRNPTGCSQLTERDAVIFRKAWNEIRDSLLERFGWGLSMI
jgi:hypothetical protein